MKSIKINFCNFWSSFNKKNNLFYNILQKHFNVEISDAPDFLICSNRGNAFEYMKYNCIRIMFMGENLSPDFTCIDYCIGFDHLDFGDRYFRLPFAFYNDNGMPWIPESITSEDAARILKSKQYFCNFIYGHPSGSGMREKLFAELGKYKEVISPGRYLNNTNTNGCSWKEKYEYLEKSKFTIACDSIHYPGFVTEKIIQPFQHHSIPIYFGSPTIDVDLNPESFVWCKNICDLDRVIEQVKYLDSHDDAYLTMLKSCPLQDPQKLVQRYRELENFLVHIFDQPLEKAGRRVRMFCAEHHENCLREYMKIGEKPELFEKISKFKKAIKRMIGKISK